MANSTRVDRSQFIADPRVLDRFSDEQLADLERRASTSPAEEELIRADVREAVERIDTVERLIGALREARLRRGMSLADVDRKSGIGRSNLSRLENMHLSNPTILRFARAVGCRLSIEVVDEPDESDSAA